jgi:glycerophosphoryl diester phosphodiesterase
MARSAPIIVAHRGLHHAAMENSLDAFRAAVAAKIPWVECDVWPSSDEVPMVIHDETVDRTTTGKGMVASHTSEQLRKLNVPTLAEVLAVLSNQTGALVEIKPPNQCDLVLDVATTLRSFNSPWMLQSFDFPNYAFAMLETLCKSAAMLFEDAAAFAEAVQAGMPCIHTQHTLLTRDVVDQIHARGGEVGAWTVNDSADIQRMIDLGIDMLITDEPELAMRMAAESIGRTQ